MHRRRHGADDPYRGALALVDLWRAWAVTDGPAACTLELFFVPEPPGGAMVPWEVGLFQQGVDPVVGCGEGVAEALADALEQPAGLDPRPAGGTEGWEPFGSEEEGAAIVRAVQAWAHHLVRVAPEHAYVELRAERADGAGWTWSLEVHETDPDADPSGVHTWRGASPSGLLRAAGPHVPPHPAAPPPPPDPPPVTIPPLIPPP